MGLVATPTHCSIKKGFKGHIIIVPNRAQNIHKASTYISSEEEALKKEELRNNGPPDTNCQSQ